MTQRIEFSEEMVGNAHPTKADTLNRFINLITAQGDILYGTAAATAAALAKGAAGALVGMNDADIAPEYKTLKVTTAGLMTNAGQPAFLAFVGALQEAVTGNGVEYNPVIFDTEVFDQGACYNNATGIFTAPITGRYALISVVKLMDLAAGTDHRIYIVTSNRSYNIIDDIAINIFTNRTMLHAVLADLDAADTARISVAVTGGTQTVDVYGDGANPYSIFGGFLVC